MKHTKKSANKPTIKNSIDVALFAAEIGDIPTIDLHGCTQDYAKTQLDSFLHHALMQGAEAIKIIHGRGGGWLREMVREYLNTQQSNKLILAYSGSNQPHELGAVTYAILTRIK